MNSKEWIELFDDSVRVSIDIVSATKNNWPVSFEIFSSDMFKTVQLPWWHVKGEPWSPHDWPNGGERYTVHSARENLAALGPKRRERIFSLAEGMEQRLSPVLLPAIRMKRSKGAACLMLADGCHRSIALSMISIKSKALLAVLEVPQGAQWDLTVGTLR